MKRLMDWLLPNSVFKDFARVKKGWFMQMWQNGNGEPLFIIDDLGRVWHT